ncbi:MAG TPA: N-acetylglucosamine-6-phosphate deacetylase [Acidobacteriaceae bacterium]|nr:N-acetylglucosamine-6-phosphate deacetylase [Acidobacteriaceae bacterium]
MRTVLTAKRLLTPSEQIEQPVLVIEDGAISSVGSLAATAMPAGQHVAFPDCTLIPALFDVHIHGCGGHDVTEATESALAHIGAFLARRGVGAYLATTVTAPLDALLRSLNGLAKLIGQPGDGALPLGIHLEGPFLSPHKRGAHPEHQLLEPSVARFEQLWQAAEGKIRLMTIAPELPGAPETIAHAAKLGVRVSLGHSNADLAAARRGVQAGAITATHTFNAMRRFEARDPGLVAEVLTNDALYAEIICDGLHVDPAAVRLFWKAKGPERALLITDAMGGTGMPDGTYWLGELEVRVKNGRCVIGEDTLAGSTLTLDTAVRNFMLFTGASLQQATALATRNPARMTGLDDEVGVLAPGRAANIAVLSSREEIVETFLRGIPSSAAVTQNSFNG